MSIRVAVCRHCESDVSLDQVVGVHDSESARRLIWVCGECETRDSFVYSFDEYRRLIGKDTGLTGEASLDSDIIGRLVQGFRVDLDELDRDWDLIVADWDYQDRWCPGQIPQEVGVGYKGLGGLVTGGGE